MTEINNILDERGNRYGDFASNATTTQLIKQAMNLGDTADKLAFYQRESLEMIAHKISRIVNGDANYMDSWVDIVGYAQLVIDKLQHDTDEIKELLNDLHDSGSDILEQGDDIQTTAFLERLEGQDD
jgi:translation initiation factor 2B subunit (eIF-2B alpha/beta/delta family)